METHPLDKNPGRLRPQVGQRRRRKFLRRNVSKERGVGDLPEYQRKSSEQKKNDVIGTFKGRGTCGRGEGVRFTFIATHETIEKKIGIANRRMSSASEASDFSGS